MRVTRVITKQGHPVPKQSHAPRGPFPPEVQGYDVDMRRPSGYGILGESSSYNYAPSQEAQPEIITDYTPFDEDTPIGATAQNNFQSPKVFKCSVCSVIVYEHEIPSHICSEADEIDGTYA